MFKFLFFFFFNLIQKVFSHFLEYFFFCLFLSSHFRTIIHISVWFCPTDLYSSAHFISFGFVCYLGIPLLICLQVHWSLWSNLLLNPSHKLFRYLCSIQEFLFASFFMIFVSLLILYIARLLLYYPFILLTIVSYSVLNIFIITD